MLTKFLTKEKAVKEIIKSGIMSLLVDMKFLKSILKLFTQITEAWLKLNMAEILQSTPLIWDEDLYSILPYKPDDCSQ